MLRLSPEGEVMQESKCPTKHPGQRACSSAPTSTACSCRRSTRRSWAATASAGRWCELRNRRARRERPAGAELQMDKRLAAAACRGVHQHRGLQPDPAAAAVLRPGVRRRAVRDRGAVRGLQLRQRVRRDLLGPPVGQ